jgi:hypothetical protein
LPPFLSTLTSATRGKFLVSFLLSRSSQYDNSIDEVCMKGIVIDTNVFVAAGFNSKIASARILAAIREGRLQLVWNEPTRRETEMILRRIPHLGWDKFADLFRPERCRPDGVDRPVGNEERRLTPSLRLARRHPNQQWQGAVLVQSG